MDCAKIWLRLSKSVTWGLGMEEGWDLTSMVLTLDRRVRSMGTGATFHSSIPVVLVLFKLERWEGLESCQRSCCSHWQGKMCLEKIYSSSSTAAFALKLELNLSTEQIQGAWIALIPGLHGWEEVWHLTPGPALLQEGVVKGLTALHGLIAQSTAICSSLLNYG